MHLHPIIYQILSAKPAKLSRVMFKLFTLPKVEVDIDVSRVRPIVPGWWSSHRLLAALFSGFLVEL